MLWPLELNRYTRCNAEVLHAALKYKWSDSLIVDNTRVPLTCELAVCCTGNWHVAGWSFQLRTYRVLNIGNFLGKVIGNPCIAGCGISNRDHKLELGWIKETNWHWRGAESAWAVSGCRHYPVGGAGTEGADGHSRLTSLKTSYKITLDK